MMHTLSLGTVLLDQLAAAVHAVQDRLQREPDREEVHAQSWQPEQPPSGAVQLEPRKS